MATDFSASDVHTDDTTHVVAVSGGIDIFSAPEFKARIQDAVETARAVVVVDLAGATFIDSSSLGVLISAHRRLALRGGRLIIACDVPVVLKTFKLTGLDAVLELVGSREEALASAAA